MTSSAAARRGFATCKNISREPQPHSNTKERTIDTAEVQPALPGRYDQRRRKARQTCLDSRNKPRGGERGRDGKARARLLRRGRSYHRQPGATADILRYYLTPCKSCFTSPDETGGDHKLGKVRYASEKETRRRTRHGWQR